MGFLAFRDILARCILIKLIPAFVHLLATLKLFSIITQTSNNTFITEAERSRGL